MLYFESKGLAKKTMGSYEQTLELFAKFVEDVFKVITIKGNVVTIGCFESNFKVYTNRVEIDWACPHQIRNNFAKRFLMAGGNIFTLSKILGYSSVTVTEKAYLDLTSEDIRKNYQKFSPLANLKNKK